MFTDEILSENEIREPADNVPNMGRTITYIHIEDNDILAAASKLKHSLSAGPDGIPGKKVKEHKHYLV